MRHFLYSRSDNRHLVTASGYLFDGAVEVYSWKVKSNPPYKIENSERDAISILPLVEMLHVRGDRENETGGFDNAIATHLGRIAALKTDSLTLKEAQEFFNAMRYHVPKY